ncbi:MAG: AI-2E family transporter [Clostridia bacterium]|nr:AI-2E family transporter [Clostridia bacterium]
MKKNVFDFNFLNKMMYLAAIIVVFYVCKNLGIVDKLLEINRALIPVYVGIIICFLCIPISRKLRKLGVGKNLAAILSLVIIYAVLALLIAIVVPMFVSQIAEFITNLPSIYTNIVVKINDFMHTTLHLSEEYSIATSIKDLDYLDFINNFKEDVLGYSITTVQSIFGFLVKFLSAIVISFFLVKDMEDINKKMINFFSNNGKNKKRYKMIIGIEDAVGSYVKGMFMDSVVVGILTTVLCFVLKLDYALVFGLIITVLNFIPYIGAIFSELLIALYAMTVGGPFFGILTFGLCLGIQLLDSNVLQPNIVAKSVDLHPALVFIGLIIGELLFGIVGMIIAVPVIAIIKVIVTARKDEIKEKLMDKMSREKDT